MIYFLVLHKLAVGFTVMSLFSIPAISLCLSGTFMSDHGHVDFFQMLKLTLGETESAFQFCSTVVLEWYIGGTCHALITECS